MDKDTIGPNYEAKCKNLEKEISYIKEEFDKKLKDQQDFYNQVIIEKDKEIAWNKKIIAGILHI